MSKKFRAIVVKKNNDQISISIDERTTDDLPNGDLLVRVEYSSLNYKDALSASGAKGVTKNYPHTPGIDAAGIVKQSNQKNFPVGSSVIVTGFDLGMNTSGGFSEYIRIPSQWAVHCPNGLSTKESMMLGTAGLTAGLAVNYIAIGLIIVLILQIIFKNQIIGIIIPSMLVMICLYMFLALISEFNEFPTFSSDAKELLFVGLSYFISTIIVSGIMIYKYAIFEELNANNISIKP